MKVGSVGYHFVGLDNFRSVLQSPSFRRALLDSFVFTIASQVIVIVCANALALALRDRFRGRGFVRFLILLPWVAPISLGAIGWKWILDSIYSVVNWVLAQLHLVNLFDPPMWLGEPSLAMASVIAVHSWRMIPFSTVILLAGLTSIPKEIPEAAAVDGAGFWRTHFEITLPMMQPIINVAVLFGVVFTFTDMTVVYILTRGGPYDTTQVLPSLAFQTGVLGSDLAEGAAISMFLVPSSSRWRRSCCASRTAPRWPSGGRRRWKARGGHRSRASGAGPSCSGSRRCSRSPSTGWRSPPSSRRATSTTSSTIPSSSTPRRRSTHLKLLFEQTLFLRWFWNTTLAGAAVVAITLVLAVPAAWALARLTGQWGQQLGIGIFLTYLIPPTLLFIPMSRVVASSGCRTRSGRSS